MWYVLFVRSGEEFKVKDLLVNEGLTAFIPRMKKMHRTEGKNSLIEVTMFPGYTFIESDLKFSELMDVFMKIKEKTSRVMKILKYDKEETSALSMQEQEYLERLLNRDKVLEHSIGFIEGDKIIIQEGPLVGLESTIIKINRHKKKATIQISLCNQLTNVNVSLEIISKI